jgi:energy-coupling factor transporter ATP-binding protein EcfA2
MTPNLCTEVKSKVKLLAFCGQSGVGKTTAAGYVERAYKNTYLHSFADGVKECAAAAFGLDSALFFDRVHKELPLPGWGVSPRMIAQYVGTEMFRNMLGRDFWLARTTSELNRLEEDSENYVYTPEDTVVIDDLRFQNEYDWVVFNGGIVVHIVGKQAETTVGLPRHESEQTGSINFHNKERTYVIQNTETETIFKRKVLKLLADFL